jgi:hypothetical protein
MTLYHVTARTNLPSILANGLDPSRAKGKRKSVWGVVGTRVAWAIVHVLSKPWNKGLSLDDLVVIRISLPKRSVRRYQTAIWYTVEGLGCIPVTEDMILDPAIFGRVGR